MLIIQVMPKEAERDCKMAKEITKYLVCLASKFWCRCLMLAESAFPGLYSSTVCQEQYRRRLLQVPSALNSLQSL